MSSPCDFDDNIAALEAKLAAVKQRQAQRERERREREEREKRERKEKEQREREERERREQEERVRREREEEERRIREQQERAERERKERTRRLQTPLGGDEDEEERTEVPPQQKRGRAFMSYVELPTGGAKQRRMGGTTEAADTETTEVEGKACRTCRAKKLACRWYVTGNRRSCVQCREGHKVCQMDGEERTTTSRRVVMETPAESSRQGAERSRKRVPEQTEPVSFQERLVDQMDAWLTMSGSALVELISTQRALVREAMASRRVLENNSRLLVGVLGALAGREGWRPGEDNGAESESESEVEGVPETWREEKGKGKEKEKETEAREEDEGEKDDNKDREETEDGGSEE